VYCGQELNNIILKQYGIGDIPSFVFILAMILSFNVLSTVADKSNPKQVECIHLQIEIVLKI